MRITFVIPYFYPAWEYGGTPRAAFELARALVQRRHELRILTTDSGGSKRIHSDRKNADAYGIKVVYFPNVSNYLAFRYRFFWPLGFRKYLRRELQESDVLHIHEFRSTLTVPACSTARKQHLPYVISPHGGLMHLGKRGLKRVFDRLWGHSILKHAAAVAAVSPLEAQDAAAFDVDRSRVHLLPNVFRPSDYDVLPAPGKFKDRWGISGTGLILFLGRLHWVKGPDLFLNAFVELAKKNAGVRAAIAGPDDGQEAALRRLVNQYGIQDRVTFTGYLDEAGKREAMRDSDVIVIPSRSEVFAITALEALMCGAPVVLSSACGLSPMPPAACGILQFRTEDIKDLEEKLTAALAAGRDSSNAALSREFITREFSAAAIAEQAETLYRGVIHAASRKG